MEEILKAFAFDQNKCSAELIGNGLINHTWIVHTETEDYILQKVNRKIFKNPGDISENTNRMAAYLARQCPDYLFISTIQSVSGKHYFENPNGDFYRLMPFVKGSHTINTVESEEQAFEAARQFGRFSKLLYGFNTDELRFTLPEFHNLWLRFEQFEQACSQASAERLKQSQQWISSAFANRDIADEYRKICEEEFIPKRVIHHDTKISNVLFDQWNKGICVIDLDTVMPGYFFSDLGDMMRTYLSPANEEEKDYSQIRIRNNFFREIIRGYFSEMSDILTPGEKSLVIYAGRFMIYMQAIRFLTDFLNGDIYYFTSYAGQNLVRSGNQFTLLEKYTAQEEQFLKIVNDLNTDLKLQP